MQREVNRQWCLARRPAGLPRESDFEWREGPVPTPGPGQILVRNRYLSLGTIDRSWMRAEATFLPPYRLGEVIRGVAVGTVAQSNLAELPAGATVMGAFGWQDFAVTDANSEFFMPLSGDARVPATMQLGLFGPAGVTAYFGLTDIARPRSGEVLVVSAAAGAVGSLAGQIGKLLGCRVIGITGSAEKCAWLTDDLGFDAAINYRQEPVFKRLRQQCPDGIDVYFDSVGGPMLEDVLNLLNVRARIVVCGMIASYNDLGTALAQPAGPNNLLNLMYRRARMEGFVCLDYWHRAHEAIDALAGWHHQGKIAYRAEVARGLRNAPRMLNALFEGSNRGKLVLEV
jgi:NADPH-dependent curcumin reductase CurA